MKEMLRCKCGREVGVVRLGPGHLVLGHRTNPGPDHHPVRLARTPRGGQESRSVPPADAPALPRLPERSAERSVGSNLRSVEDTR